MILGTISAVDNDNGLQLIIDGEDDPTTKKYTYMASYVPTANDRVLIEEISGSYVIMGKVISDVGSSGIARTAETATTATTATTAVNATTATTAGSCSGNAATATLSEKTKALDTSFSNTELGTLVTNVTTEYISSIGRTVVTGVQRGNNRNFAYK